MTSILFLSLILFINDTNAKKKSDDHADALTKEFIAFIKKDYSLENKIYLVDKPETKEFQNCLDWILQDSVVTALTSKESIIQAIVHPLVTCWTAELTRASVIIPHDTINSIFTRPHARGWDYFNKRYGDHYYIFSSPIFFNNGTMCLFYIDYHCGEMCNEGRIRLYKKDNHGWKVLKEFCSWMS